MLDETDADEGERKSFTKFKSIELPRNIVIGKNAIEEVGETCKRLELKNNALLICDDTTKEVAGEKVADILSEYDHEVDIEVISEADQNTVDEITDLIDEDIGFLLGVGGGRSIDID